MRNKRIGREISRDRVLNVSRWHSLKPMVESVTHRFAADEFVVENWCDVSIGPVVVADSWAVRSGLVVGLEHHLSRFRSGLAAQGVTVDPQPFMDAVIDKLPRDGEWFPRIEAVTYGDGVLFRYLERAAPQRETSVSVVRASRDPRTQPTVKGPDLAELGTLRVEAQHKGAQEAIICDSRGAIIEGAYSSLWWWKNDRIFRPKADLNRIDSVTDRVLREHAIRIGATITEVEASPAELDGCELWVLSAAHGIRVATEWMDGPNLSSTDGRVSYWRTCYDNLAVPLP
jgi:branched-subunit amino acid aminotransferase/4-amino-4-deoxychorismate lyase